MEDKWFMLIRDTVGIAGNIAECIGVIFLFTQFRRKEVVKSSPTPIKQRTYQQ